MGGRDRGYPAPVFSDLVPLSLPHRALIVLRRPGGVVRALWDYAARSAPVHRVESAGDRSDLPEPVNPAVWDHRVQGVEHGVGPLLHRLYAIQVDGPSTGAGALIREFAQRPNRGAPAYMAVFVKTRGRPESLAVGDEFSIRMPGPWNGPVRVIDVGPSSFRLATLDGHLEAGQIEFRATDGAGGMTVEIESRARSGDLLAHLLYNWVGLAKEIQLNLWVETLLRLAERSGGSVRDGVHITTRRVPTTLTQDA